MAKRETDDCLESIAIIGMAGRFPGAKTIEQFWQNLCDGRESILFFTDEELVASGVDPTLLNDPNYVKACPVLEDIEMFDASFFGFTSTEAEVMDPQHRLFLECAWEALENAGYNSDTYEGLIGVYAGAALNTYLLRNLISHPEIFKLVSSAQILIGNDQNFVPTRVSYKLNLKGPSVNVGTACSTSLVAVQMACQSLLNYQCDMVLAGGVTIASQKEGYLYQEGGIASPDGHCRAFDAKAQGTIGGDGVGIVVLKRFEDALADGDNIYAVIRGAEINNDGSLKAGYTAPSTEGQAKVIAEALAIASVAPETITYIETHGTGTNLGDPIEIAALTKVFRANTNKKGFCAFAKRAHCAIGSVKTNIGHLGTAAGVAGLIKTILALKHKMIPPSLHFEQPNPKIDFANSPFYVNTKLCKWETQGIPRRAGVSSFGIGGTNAHIVLEEAPVLAEQRNTDAEEQGKEFQLLVVSAKTESALETATINLAEYLERHPETNLADAAYTLQVGRWAFNYRRIIVCQELSEAITALKSLDPQRVFTHLHEPKQRSIAFMFPGQGAQYVNMTWGLYRTEPIFRDLVDFCCEQLKPHLNLDLRHILYSGEEQPQASQQLKQTYISQSALFVTEYALAKLWMSWGVCPQVMIGHSVGEYVAATLAGVFSLKDALVLVATRGRLMQQLPYGSMLSIPLPEKQIIPLLGEKLSLAANNAPSVCVVSGTTDAINDLQNRLLAQGVDCRRLQTSHAFHSEMMNPILEEFTLAVKRVNLKPPEIPFVSNLTGTWITLEQATSANYWAEHLRSSVRFSEGITELLKDTELILLEVGPGRTLSTLTMRHQIQEQIVLSSIHHPQDQQSDVAFLLETLGRLWLAGVQVNWSEFYANQRRHRIPLPTYPFERQRYWIEPQKQVLSGEQLTQNRTSEELWRSLVEPKQRNVADWFYIPSWKRSLLPQPFKIEFQGVEPGCWLVFVDECGLGEKMVKQLALAGEDTITVRVGEQFDHQSDRLYTINPQQPQDYDTLLTELGTLGKKPKTIVHLWSVTDVDRPESAEVLGFYSLLFLAQAITEQNLTDSIEIGIVSNNMQQVTGLEMLCPEKALVLGLCKVMPLEYPNITCRSIDIDLPLKQRATEKLINQLLAELTTKTSEDRVIAYRGFHRWVQDFQPVQLNGDVERNPRLRDSGVYLITGGLGGVGLALAEYLAQTVQAKLILIGRSPIPKHSEWEQWLLTHEQQDAVSSKIRKLQTIEALGAQIMVINADITNSEQMSAAIQKANHQFGEIHGVIHAAAVPGGGMIQLTTQQAVACGLAPKVKGTRVLDLLFKETKLDFFVLCSSLSSFTGGLGIIDYTAENAFLDAFAYYRTAQNDSFTVSINWDRWKGLGMAVAVEARHKAMTGEDIVAGMTLAEGIEAFRRILYSSTVPQVIVSTQDFPSQIHRKDNVKSFKNELASKPTHPRPRLRNVYVAPSNEIESTLADIWQQILGIELVGIYDNFFELGGDSLFAAQLVSRLCKTFEIELPYKNFFSGPTVAELALVIIQKLAEQTDREALAQALAEIEQLSEDEAQEILASQAIGGSNE
ncbi:MAG: beta-ketoacyl synthase N-terminal-like domain-containing protein [Rhizonema sp. PD37]|nr:beta-ketoacyl synthase N-terminal-like domain-containing protein [Rhizonema sp. PD37]